MGMEKLSLQVHTPVVLSGDGTIRAGRGEGPLLARLGLTLNSADRPDGAPPQLDQVYLARGRIERR